MENTELTIELGVEEIPASILEKAAQQFAKNIVRNLREQRLTSGDPTVWYTPRRIIVGIQDVPIQQDDLIETIIGPPKRIGYDAVGIATKAALAFAEKNGVSPTQIKLARTEKGEYLSIERKVRGEKTSSLLKTLIPDAIQKIEFPKTMHWSADHFRFIRPLRWIVALFGGKVVRFKLADVVSSKYTTGHRFLGKSKIEVSDLHSLKNQLRLNSVIVDNKERHSLISEGLLREAEACGGHILEDPELLDTVVNLNEAPSTVRGSFERRFLLLPKEILITVMREHQKYFSVLNDSEQLMPYFLAVVNLQSDKLDNIRTGHERVLRARLADAAFFWDTDRKLTLVEREASLKDVLFQEKLGSYHDKTRRVLSLLPRIAQTVGKTGLIKDLENAGRIFKCDLITEMVKEFTDLQGVVGGLYARAEGLPDAVWQAVYEQYYPKTVDSPAPASETGAILALADRLDTVCGCFSIGLIPSGSGDPFAVRRQGNGILKIIFDHRLNISMDQLIRWSLETHERSSEQTLKELREFFEGRLKFMFEGMGYAYDFVHAVLAAGLDDPMDAFERLRALHELRNEDDFLSLVSNFKRIINILSKTEISETLPDTSKFESSAESSLWESYLNIRPVVEAAGKQHDYSGALKALASVRQSVDKFFQEVMVMAEDTAVRNNRVALLNCISKLFTSLADISKIVIERSA
jgi:glycyl-tRNA synthetase beta chain